MDTLPRSVTCVTVAQLMKATRDYDDSDAHWKFDKTVFGRVMLVGNLTAPKVDPGTGELTFQLDDSTGRILVRAMDPQDKFPLPLPHTSYPFSTVVRVIGTMFLPHRGTLRSITADSCALAQDPHEPYHHLLRVIVDYMLGEKGPFPSELKLPVSTESEDDEDEEQILDHEESGADFQALTSSLAKARLDTTEMQAGPSTQVSNPIAIPQPATHLYPPQSPLSSVSPPRVAYCPKANGDLDNTFIFLDNEGAPKPTKAKNTPTQHVYPPQRQYDDMDIDVSPPRQQVPPPLPSPPNLSGFNENGDLDESFVFLDSNQVQSRANGAPYLPSRHNKLPVLNGLSISPPTPSFLRRRSPPQRDSPSSKKARRDPLSQLDALQRDIILTMHNVKSQQPASMYYGNHTDGISRDYIIRTVTRKKPQWTTKDIIDALEKLVADAFLIRPIDSDHFLIN